MHSDETVSIIPQKPPPPPRREVEPLHPLDPVEAPVRQPIEAPDAPVTPTQPRETRPSRPPASRRERSGDGRSAIPSRPSDPEIISRRNDRPTMRGAGVTTAAIVDFPTLALPDRAQRRRSVG